MFSLDHVDSARHSWQAIRFKIMRNIGHAFFKMHQFPDAIDSYENLLMHGAQHLDFMTGFNLILCYFALGDKATWLIRQKTAGFVLASSLVKGVFVQIHVHAAFHNVSPIVAWPTKYGSLRFDMHALARNLKLILQLDFNSLQSPGMRCLQGQDEERLSKASQYWTGRLGRFWWRRRDRAGSNWRAAFCHNLWLCQLNSSWPWGQEWSQV